jgi:hypothetical protein
LLQNFAHAETIARLEIETVPHSPSAVKKEYSLTKRFLFSNSVFNNNLNARVERFGIERITNAIERTIKKFQSPNRKFDAFILTFLPRKKFGRQPSFFKVGGNLMKKIIFKSRKGWFGADVLLRLADLSGLRARSRQIFFAIPANNLEHRKRFAD